LISATCPSGIASAADIKVIASGALKLALTQLLPEFHKSSGKTAVVEYGPAGAVAKRIEGGEAADVAIVSDTQLDSLVAKGRIVPGSGRGIAGIAIGVATRKGALKPDIGTVEAFKRTLLAARAIGYRDPATGSTSGTYTARMIERLGIAREMQAKTKLDNSNGEHPEDVFEALITGQTDLQLGQITEIVLAPSVELLGPLPSELQQVTLLKAGIPTASKASQVAKAFIDFLASPSTAATLQANGFEPVGSR
jgi:molybdate transport system substrate-binding protein